MIELLRSCGLAFYVLLYVVSPFIKVISGVETTTQKIICLVLFIVFTIFSKCKISDILFIVRFIASIIVLLILQYTFCPPHIISDRMILNLILFFFVSLKSFPIRSLKIIFISVKIGAVIVALNVFSLYMLFGFYARGESLIDKEMISVIFALCFMICWIDIILNRNQILNIIIMAFVLYVDIFIVVSKTSVFAAFCFILITYFCLGKEERRQYFKIFCYLVAIFCIVLLFVPDIVLSDDLKETINAVAGRTVYELDGVRKDDTFSVRGEILHYSIHQLFFNHPLIGIGIGNFYYYNHSAFSELDQTESSMLAIITEGGIYYTLVMIIFYYSLLKKGFLRMRRKLGYEECLAFGLPCVYFIICFGNDFMDILYWMMMGISYSILYGKSRLSLCKA